VVRQPEQHFVFEPLSTDALEDRATSLEETGLAGFHRLAQDELCGRVDLSAPCFTPHGSFWTGDVRETITRYSVGEGARLETCSDTKSLALIPFAVDERNVGLLRLESAQQGAFTGDLIESYEAVVETIGLSIAERRARAALRERVKELSCLYTIARVAESDLSVDEALDRIAALLPPAWQFAEIAVARIVLDGTIHETADFEATRSQQVAKIVVNGVCRGAVAVGYVDQVRHAINGPFLKEEESLIEAVARDVGDFVEKRETAKERSRMEAQLRHADRLATIGQLAAGVAHEINEPLGGILGFAQLALKGGNVTESTVADLNKIIASSLHAREIVNQLKLFARQAPIQKSRTSVFDIVGKALALVEGRCASEGIELVRRSEGDLHDVNADPVQLEQVFVNLVVNAIQVMPGGGALTVATGCDESSAIIEVQDSGAGMTDEVMRQVFNPFFTTKDVGEGTGLGLSVAHGNITAHGGTIDVESEAGTGAKFTVRLPLAAVPETEGREGPG
jgi:signal transduction histidine kinase